MSIIKDLEWRYATKAMNGSKIEDQQRREILEAMRLAPTSLGLQPLKFYLVQDQSSKEKVSEAAYKQPQIAKSDSVIVIASRKSLEEEWLDDLVKIYQEERTLNLEQTEEMKTRLLNYTSQMSEEQFSEWTSRQAYIALGMGMAAAARLRVDSTPMEGFQSAELDKIMGLDKTNFKSNILLVLGHRDTENDFLVDQKKVRYPYDTIVEEVAL